MTKIGFYSFICIYTQLKRVSSIPNVRCEEIASSGCNTIVLLRFNESFK